MPGQIIILNGVPRSGKSSIAKAIVDTFPGHWQNIGVDFWIREKTPDDQQPAIGLRPGGERPDLEPDVQKLYADLHQHIANLARQGTNVVCIGSWRVRSSSIGQFKRPIYGGTNVRKVIKKKKMILGPIQTTYTVFLSR